MKKILVLLILLIMSFTTVSTDYTIVMDNNNDDNTKIETRVVKKKITDKIKRFVYFYNNINLDNKILLSGNEIITTSEKWGKFLKISYNQNRKIESFISKINNFLKDNKIKQNIYKGWWQKFTILVKSDWVKCWTYTTTIAQLFTQYLIWFRLNFKSDYKNIFIETDKSRLDNNLRYHYAWWTNSDIQNYLTSISYWNYWYKRLYNGYWIIDFISVKLWKKVYHSWLKICWLYRCYVYFPDEGEFIEENKYKSIWKYRNYTIDLSFNIIKNVVNWKN